MKNTLQPKPTPQEWDARALFTKSQRYFELMLAEETNSWNFALFSSLALELLARAALANVSPVLLVSLARGDFDNLSFVLGYPAKGSKYIPNSIIMSEVCSRLAHLFSKFDPTLAGFCASHTSKRNGELHSGATPFDGVQGGTWQPKFYKCCQVLLETMGMDLPNILPKSEIPAATAMILADERKDENAALAQIAAHERVWQAKDKKEQIKLLAEANAWATKSSGHRVDCPSCKSPAIVTGPVVGEQKKTLKDDQVIEKVEHFPTKFECVACGLKMSGAIKLAAAHFANRYTSTTTYDALAYYSPEEPEPEYDYEPDNND